MYMIASTYIHRHVRHGHPKCSSATPLTLPIPPSGWGELGIEAAKKAPESLPGLIWGGGTLWATLEARRGLRGAASGAVLLLETAVN